MHLFKADPNDESAFTGALLLAEYMGSFRSLYRSLAKPAKR